MLRISMDQVEAVITNLNPRVERHGQEEKEIGLDVDADLSIPVDLLNDFSNNETHIDYDNFLFNDKGEMRSSGVKELTFDRKYEEHNVVISMDNINNDTVELELVTVKISKATPIFGHKVRLHIKIQCSKLDDGQYLFLRDCVLKDMVLIEIIEPAQRDMIDEQEAE